MFKKKRHVSEDFDVGKANMETPNYEIKINGQVPIDYATAINDRQKRIDKIEKDFEKKDELTDEFIEEQEDRRMNESFDSKLYDEAVALSKTLDSFITKIGSFVDTDFAMVGSDMDTLNRAVEALDTFATLYFEEKYPLRESSKAEQIKRRGRPKADPKDKMFSEDDLWLQVYDDLSSEVDNEGKGKEVNKQVKIPRGKRFIGPYAGPGDYDLTVYGKNMEDLQWAKKVADHYGVDIEIKKDNNSNTNSYYPYVAILKDVK